MPTEEELRKNRIEKLKRIREKGMQAYPAETKRTHTIKECLNNFKNLEKKEEEVVLAGRIRAIREHGGSTFVDLKDGAEKIQLFYQENTLGEEDYNFFLDNFDIGDFIEVKGKVFETNRGEETLEVKEYKILSKSILPLPEKWHGLQDTEERYRKRYLDIMFNEETRDMIIKKSKFWQSVREFLEERDFLEVQTPVLETTPGGADARPFKTHHNALDIDLYLRISMGELWQKKLMVAGLNKTFEIGRQFRNEGIDPEHLQDYTQMEFYWAYASYKDGMELVKKLYRHIAKEVFGKLKFKIRGFDIDLSEEWEEYDYRSVVLEKTGVDVLDTDLDEVKVKLKELGIKYDKKGFNLARGIDNLWKHCRKEIQGPGFLVNIPIIVSPLAKRKKDNPDLAQRFQPIIAGSELGNGYSELNDPLDQAERFKKQQEMREAGDEEAQQFDKGFVKALSYGMPPTCGFGMSERVFSFFMDKSLKECQIFPLMKPKNND